MSRFDESNAECLVFTFKEGILSAVAHDLKIRVQRFRIDVDEDAGTVDARFDAAALRVVCAMRDGAESPGTLSADQRREIEQNIVRHVLRPDAHPEIRFVSTSVDEAGDGFRVHGELALSGRRRPVDVALVREPGRYVATARVHQPDFGIRPYSALLGALKVKADVEVRVVVPYPPDASPTRAA
jgi:polyisoprenoid-binding protein YceI